MEVLFVRTYVPTTVIDVHRLAIYLARYQSVIRPVMVALDPAYGAIFDGLLSAALAFDAIAQVLYPLED